VGSSLVCQLAGRVTVAGLTDAPVPWPYRAIRGAPRPLILCGDLVRAVRTESAEAICHHWGVSRWWVRDCRKALGVGRVTAGTAARMRELAPTRLPAEARQRGGQVGGALQAAASAKRPLHLSASGPAGPLTLYAASGRGRALLTRLGWTGDVPAADYGRLIRAALGAGVTLVVHPPRE
jgi:hypothetical protein